MTRKYQTNVWKEGIMGKEETLNFHRNWFCTLKFKIQEWLQRFRQKDIKPWIFPKLTSLCWHKICWSTLPFTPSLPFFFLGWQELQAGIQMYNKVQGTVFPGLMGPAEKALSGSIKKLIVFGVVIGWKTFRSPLIRWTSETTEIYQCTDLILRGLKRKCPINLMNQAAREQLLLKSEWEISHQWHKFYQ